MRLTTPAFADGEAIPRKYTCDGEDVSPPLEWCELPEGTQSLALILDDPDAPRGLFVHWLLYGVPATENGVTEGTGGSDGSAAGGRQGKNGFGKLGYGGPCPPSGRHRYYFHLFAVDHALDLPAGATRQQLDAALQGHILAEAQLMGTYQRA